MKKISLVILIVALFFNSCVTTEKAVYFNNIQNKEFAETNVAPVIQKSDILSISVSSLNAEATIIFNTPNQNGNNSNPQVTGYLVNSDGIILFPILGKIKVQGLTEKDFSENLAATLVEKKLLVDPIVNVRIINFKVTVLGEVAKPTVVQVPNEKISMLEAIGMAGDMTLYAKRDNVLLIRVENGKKITRRIDLNSPNFLESPFYYLKTNDIVYVEPNKAKVASTGRSQQVLPLVFSALTFVAIILDRIIPRR
jgi:polysaccharide export outer membrane protein